VKALSICQPWAWLILHAGKDVENRTYRTSHRGVVLLHVPRYPMFRSDCVVRGSKFPHLAMYGDWPRKVELQQWVSERAPGVVVPPVSEMPMGGIVGWFNLFGCVEGHPSPWSFAHSRWQWMFDQVHHLPFTPCKGRPGLFDIDNEAGFAMCANMYDQLFLSNIDELGDWEKKQRANHN